MAGTPTTASAATSSETSTAAYRNLNLNLISSKDLKSVNLLSRMSVYAVVSLSGDPRRQQRTPPDREGGRNPTWNSSLRLNVPADLDPPGRPCFLLITLRTERFLGDRNVGEVRVPLQDLLSGAPVDGPVSTKFLSYQVRRVVSGKPQGVLNFSYSLSERIVPSPPPAAVSFMPPAMSYPPQDIKPNKGEEEPVMAYPVGATSSAYPPYPQPYGYHQPPPSYGYAPAPPQHQQGYGYPPAPPQHQQGYGYPPAPPQHQQGYSYPPAPAGYGYPPAVAQQQKQRKNRPGMGLGAGLLGGALGGLLIGDMLSDAAAYDAGYDAGFDDSFDF